MEPRGRANMEQFATMLEFMESHGDLAKPQTGPQGRVRAEHLWREITGILNGIGGGVNKTVDKWKKVWADWKSKTKKKSLAIRLHTTGTGGGPSSRQTLSAFEERVLAIMGPLAVTGSSNTAELGFDRPSESTQHSSTVAVCDTAQLAIEMSTVNDFPILPSPSPPPSSTPIILPTSAPATPPSPLPSTSRSRQSSTATTSQAVTSPRRQPLRARRRLVPAQPLAPPPSCTPPSTSRRRRLPSPTTPQSEVLSPQHSLIRLRRRRALTPFDRAASEYAAIEHRRLQNEEARDRQFHERESRRIEMDQERNKILNSFFNIAQGWLDHYRSRDNTEPLNNV